MSHLESLHKAFGRFLIAAIAMVAGSVCAFADSHDTAASAPEAGDAATTVDSIPYVHILYKDENAPDLSLAEFSQKAASVVFRVNKTDIAPDNAFLRQIRQKVLPRIEALGLELCRIDIRGAASPEGPIDNNRRLAVARANVLRDSITAILPAASGDITHIASVTEDYELLVNDMELAQDPDAALVKSIVSQWLYAPLILKQKLIAAKGHTLWPRLLKVYFPSLRATRVILYFHVAPETAPRIEPLRLVETLPHPDTRKTISLPASIPPLYFETEEEGTVHRRPVLAVSTNLLYDLWYMPDFGFAPMWNGRIEYYPYRDRRSLWNHTSFAISFTNPYYHKWDEHKFFQIRNYEIEARWYHHYDSEWQQRYGWYLGAALDNNIYGIGLSDTRGWEGEGLGGQITGGYVLPLDKCKSWKLEFNLGLGIYGTRYDPYIYDDPFKDANVGHGEYDPSTFHPDPELHYYYKWYGSAADFRKRQHRFIWMGPTQIGISLKYDLLWKRKQRHGVSFRHTETVIKPVVPTEKGGEQ